MVNGKMILMCGGPADGRWVAVEPLATYQDVIKPGHPPVQVVSTEQALSQVQADLERVRYHIVPVKILTHDLWVGVCEDEAYDDRAVLRAILQRDVADRLGAYRR